MGEGGQAGRGLVNAGGQSGPGVCQNGEVEMGMARLDPRLGSRDPRYFRQWLVRHSYMPNPMMPAAMRAWKRLRAARAGKRR